MNGQLGTLTSSARFKDNIRPMDKASESLLALKPVTFRYKKEIDPAGTSQFGLVAEEVEKVNSSLVVRDKDGKPYSVRYEQVNAMLLNEFLKEHRTVEVQQNEINALQAELKEQRALIQKVNDKVELTKPVPQTVLTISKSGRYFTISRHASPRGGFLFHAVTLHRSLKSPVCSCGFDHVANTRYRKSAMTKKAIPVNAVFQKTSERSRAYPAAAASKYPKRAQKYRCAPQKVSKL